MAKSWTRDGQLSLVLGFCVLNLASLIMIDLAWALMRDKGVTGVGGGAKL